MGSLSDHKNAALGGSGSLADREAAFWAGLVGGPGVTEIAYAENVTNVGTTVAGTTGVAGTAVDIPNLTLVVPITTRPVYLEAGFTIIQTVAGLGEALLQILEGAGNIEWCYRVLPNSASVRGRTLSLFCKTRLGPVVAERTFKVAARCDSVAANTPSFSVVNLTAAKSFFVAYSK